MKRERWKRWYVFAVVLAAGAAAPAALGLAPGTPAAASAAASSIVRPGFYDGHAGTHWYAEVVVASSGTRFRAFSFDYTHGSCSDGRRFSSGESGLVRSGPISATGRISYSRRYRRAFEFDRRGRRINGTERLTFAARFSGTHLTGVLHDTFRGRGLRCASGPLAFSADLDGTGNAPLQTAYATTGSYSGIDPLGKPVVLRTFLPWGLITRFTIISHLGDCTGGLSVHGNDHWTLYFIPLRGHSFRFSGQNTTRAGGFVARHHLALAGAMDVISGDPTTYGAHGVWSDTARIYRGGRRVATCTTGRYPFDLQGPSHPAAASLERHASAMNARR